MRPGSPVLVALLLGPLTLGVAGCPSDPTFVISDVAADAVTVDTSGPTDTATADDTVDAVTTDAADAADAADVPDGDAACGDGCEAGEYCANGACATCEGRCAALFAKAACGVDECGEVCACGGGVGCVQEACPCADASCQVAVQPGNASQADLAFGPHGAPSVILAPRTADGTLLFARWLGSAWDVKDTAIPFETEHFPHLAISDQDDVWVVRSVDGEGWAYRRTASDWHETLVTAGNCSISDIAWNRHAGVMAVACADALQQELNVYEWSGNDSWSPLGSPLALTVGSSLTSVDWGVDAAGTYVVAWIDEGTDGDHHVRSAYRKGASWISGEVTTFPAVQMELAVALSVESADDPQLFWTMKANGNMDLMHAWREEDTWKSQSLFRTSDLDPMLDAVPGPDGAVHVAFGIAGDPAFVTTQRGVVSDQHTPVIDDPLTGLAMALDARGEPQAVWTDGGGHVRLWTPRSSP